MNRTITKGTRVRVTTTNGGDMTGILVADYRPDHGWIEISTDPACPYIAIQIGPERLRSMEIANR